MVHEIEHDELILIRTHEGQLAICDAVLLDADQRRLLHLVNGFTPLRHLKKRLDTRSDWSGIARQLLDKGLVSVVGD
jgi:hypothetical protein